jgi:prepilin-type N-terminal cleavage/methylation domain-containing protein
MGPVGQDLKHGRSQAGLTLIEVLISTVIIALVVGAASAGIIIMTASAAKANNAARANVLATGVGEVLKKVDYIECTRGDLEDQYQALFDQSQADLPAERRLLKPGESAVVAVEDPDDEPAVKVACDPVDPGVQNISFIVTVGEGTEHVQSRSVEIVKRNPDYADAVTADVEACLVTSITPSDGDCSDGDVVGSTGDAIAIFEVTALGSSPQARIVEYAYDCGNGGEVLRTTTPDDPNITCDYVAEAAPYSRLIKLTITDTAGRTRSDDQRVVVPAVQEARQAPTAKITATCGSTPCTGGAADLTVSFSGAGSTSLQGTIVEYEWEFTDCSGSSLRASGVTVSFTYIRNCPGAGASLVVTDEAQKSSAPATVSFSVTRPGPQPPIPAFTFSPPLSVAPQLVTFDPSGSRSASGGPVDSYFWNFGNGATSTAPAASYRYANAGTYTVTLTVTAGSLQASTTRQVVVESFVSNPTDSSTNFRLAASRGLLGFDLIVRGSFDFAWQNVPRSSGDVVWYEVDMEHVGGPWYIPCIANFGPRQFRVDTTDPAVRLTGTFRYSPPSPSRVCYQHTYRWRVRSHRESPTEGTITSAWTAWSNHTVSDT